MEPADRSPDGPRSGSPARDGRCRDPRRRPPRRRTCRRQIPARPAATWARRRYFRTGSPGTPSRRRSAMLGPGRRAGAAELNRSVGRRRRTEPRTGAVRFHESRFRRSRSAQQHQLLGGASFPHRPRPTHHPSLRRRVTGCGDTVRFGCSREDAGARPPTTPAAQARAGRRPGRRRPRDRAGTATRHRVPSR